MKVINWAKKFAEEVGEDEEEEPSEEIIAEGIEVLLWLLIHINEIFTGDELFVLNPIVWQQLEIDPWPTFDITKTWKYTDGNWWINPSSDPQIAGETIDFNGDAKLAAWNDTAKVAKDNYMQWLMEYIDPVELAETIWTQFSFDIVQFWMKNFHIEIDVGELTAAAGGESVNPADAFGGCDIEFFLFTHHLAGSFLYDDNNTDGTITVDYTPKLNESSPTGENLKNPDGTDMMFPNTTEITHQVMLGTVDKFDFKAPEVDSDGDVVWGITLKDATITPVPVGVDLNNYLHAEQEDLKYIYFGLEFVTDIGEPDEEGAIEASGKVKLDHNFAPWNDGVSPYTKNDVDGLDLSIIYVSSIFHFHLQVDTENEDTDAEGDIDDYAEDYENSSSTVKVGNYLSEDASGKLDFIDLMGPGYKLGEDDDLDGTPNGNTDRSAAFHSHISISIS
jgi:hypothetical protein